MIADKSISLLQWFLSCLQDCIKGIIWFNFLCTFALKYSLLNVYVSSHNSIYVNTCKYILVLLHTSILSLFISNQPMCPQIVLVVVCYSSNTRAYDKVPIGSVPILSSCYFAPSMSMYCLGHPPPPQSYASSSNTNDAAPCAALVPSISMPSWSYYHQYSVRYLSSLPLLRIYHILPSLDQDLRRRMKWVVMSSRPSVTMATPISYSLWIPSSSDRQWTIAGRLTLFGSSPCLPAQLVV